MADLSASPIFSCRNCRNPLALRADLLSKSYMAKSGQAYLFSHAMNIVVGKKEDKELLSGVFCIADIYCSKCGETLGWKYVKAYNPKQSFKEGKYILEKAKILKEY